MKTYVHIKRMFIATLCMTARTWETRLLPSWSGSKRREWRQNTKSGAVGEETCSLYWTEVQSPLWVQILFLSADYKNFFGLTFSRHILFQSHTPKCHGLHRHSPDFLIFIPGCFLFGQVSRTISKCVGSVHAWRRPSVPKPMLSWSQSYSLLGLALGFVTRLLF